MSESKIDTLVPGQFGNTKQTAPSKWWCFTLNNFEWTEVLEIRSIDPNIVPILVFQHECGENGTDHIQGTLKFKEKNRPSRLKLSKRIHWEKTRNIEKAIDYCNKDLSVCATVADFYYSRGIEEKDNYDILNEEMNGCLYPWEAVVCEWLERKPDNRTINWIVGEACNEGKTVFQKYIVNNYKNVILCGGKAHDMKNSIVQFYKDNKRLPEIVLINIPKTFNAECLSYQGLENIKDMCFYSGKYEGGMICGRCPHVIVFSNEYPVIKAIDQNRWKIKFINFENKDFRPE